jgi:hypothetical protein
VRVAVVGGTGLAGGHAIEALKQAGHDPVAIARSTGVDVTTGAGLAAALAGVQAVIDVTNTPAIEPAEVRRFFTASTANLLDAGQRAGVRHHVLLSIVGIDRVAGTGHYAGKRRQEELVEAGPVPFTILRATQFFEFAEMVVGRTRHDGSAVVAPLLVQPSPPRTSATRSPRRPQARRRAGRPTSPGPRPRTSSTWPGARWPPAATARGWYQAGRPVSSAPRWQVRSCCPVLARGSRPPPSTCG